MKRSIIAIILFACLCFQGFGQIPKGTVRLGTGLGFNSTKQVAASNEFKSNAVSTSISAGGFAAKNFEISALVEYARDFQDFGTTEIVSYDFYAGPLLTYMIPIGEEL